MIGPIRCAGPEVGFDHRGEPANRIDVANIQGATARDVAGIGAASAREVAEIGAESRIEGIKLQIASDWAITMVQDATRRFVAEGDWGMQKYVAELAETGAMERLQIEIGFREKALAQEALIAQNQHHEAMIGLALEVAKFDATLAQEPRNWLAYASWLSNRDIVVNGMSLAAAADFVDPQLAAAAAAENVELGDAGGLTAQTEIEQQQVAGGEGLEQAQLSAPEVTPELAQTATTGQDVPVSGQNVSGIDLTSTDYANIARQLLGLAPGAESEAPSTEQLQETYNLTTGGRLPGEGPGWMQNAQGMQIQGRGDQVRYDKFKDMASTLQEMNLGGVQSVRGKFGINDFVKELERSRPKGSASGKSGGLA